jgi:hypothetical protein
MTLKEKIMSNSKIRLVAAFAGIALAATVSLAYAEPSSDMILQQHYNHSVKVPASDLSVTSEYTGSLKGKPLHSVAPTANPSCSNSTFDQDTEVACNTPHGG